MVGRGWVLEFTRLMLISTKVEVGVELGNFLNHGVILSDRISQNVFYVIVRELVFHRYRYLYRYQIPIPEENIGIGIGMNSDIGISIGMK